MAPIRSPGASAACTPVSPRRLVASVLARLEREGYHGFEAIDLGVSPELPFVLVGKRELEHAFFGVLASLANEPGWGEDVSIDAWDSEEDVALGICINAAVLSGGLTLLRKAVEAHGGGMLCQSENARRYQITLVLPAVRHSRISIARQSWTRLTVSACGRERELQD
ncbi:hypothetical protein [Novosphingobium sp. BW1]|uniref:hypothetical protein n=1 Tax=Novosphingobium sp. BW1 TaxID=2592621 RepID=UPI0011DEEF78|nr:hypothetical protein [Novosphingobium sp. BW1]TYC93070.1 hypothetical protein FMM79_03535 [Novosphingobium sp. BW1]